MAVLMRALRFALALVLLGALPARAADVLIVQSGRSTAYEESLSGFRSEYKGTTRTIVLSDYAEVDVVRLVKEDKPRLVLAVGDAALAASRKVRQLPVVGLLTLSLNLARGAAGSIGGVGVLPPPERYLELFRSIGAVKVGLINDPHRTGHYVQRARQAANRIGIELVVREVHTARETPALLEQMRGTVDALWMLPDTTVVTAETLEAWFLFSLREKVPVVTFSEQYLAKGAALSLDVDRVDLGRQAAGLAVSLLAGEAGRPVILDARKFRINANQTVAGNLGLALPPAVK